MDRACGRGPGAAFADLLATDDVAEGCELRSRFGVMAFHGGHLEAVTDVVATRAAAAAGASCYTVWHPPDLDVHLASTEVSPNGSAALARFLDHVDVVITLHGYGRRGRWTDLLAGGRNRALADHLADHLGPALPDYRVVTDLAAIPDGLGGQHPANPVNLPPDGGVQLELPPRVRGRSPRSPPPGPDGISPPTRALIAGLAEVARTWPAAG